MNGCMDAADIDLAAANDPVNQWIITELAQTAGKVSTAIEEYRFNEAADCIYQFIWHSYCDWYLELIKPQLGEGQSSEAGRVAPKVLAEAIRLLHPMMPFITEELWEKVFAGKDMLITSSWPEAPDANHGEAAAEIGFVVDLVTAVRSIRNEMNVPASAKPELVLREGDTDLAGRIDRNRNAIGLAWVSAITIVANLLNNLPSGLLTVPNLPCRLRVFWTLMQNGRASIRILPRSKRKWPTCRQAQQPGLSCQGTRSRCRGKPSTPC